ncbi:MAG: ArsA-related P-loop ATPase [Actinomycetes bacterium]
MATEKASARTTSTAGGRLPDGTPRLHIDSLLDDRAVHVIVCCGSGGVGKTTVAASLALRAAERGRKVCVMTIDPAKRLAQSMGLTELDNTPRAVNGVIPCDGANSGRLDAMMLDMKRTFDEIVQSHQDTERAQAILDNPFYQALSSSFAGTQEYMAMEKLGQLRNAAATTGQWDLIVVDTPPSRSALDFLDAPQRLGSFLDGRLMRLLAAPARGAGKLTGKIVTVGFTVVTGTITKVIGAQVLKDLQLFVASFDAMFGGFRERAEATYRQLQAPDTRFIVVAAPDRDALREASYFVERLATEQMPLSGLVLNRVATVPLPQLTRETAIAGADRLDEAGEHAVVSGMLRLHADKMQLAKSQRRMAERFCSAHPSVAVATAAALPGDVHDLDGLREVGQALAND